MNHEWISTPMSDPAERLNLNDSLPAAKWARAKRREQALAWREGAHWMILATPLKKRPKPTGKVTVTVLFGTSRPNQRRDPSNWVLTAKHIVDGLTDAGLWPDDDKHHVYVAEPEFTNTIRDRHFAVKLSWEGPDAE
jgi:hypothetical protein